MFTWIDFLVVLGIILCILDGYRQGFLRVIIEIVSIFVALFAALRFYNFVGHVLSGYGVEPNLAKPLGFLIIWVIVQLFFWIIALLIVKIIPEKVQKSKLNKYSGMVLGLAKGTLIIAIFLTVLMILPLAAKTKKALNDARLSNLLIKQAAGYESRMELVFGKMNGSLTLLGVMPKSESKTKLNFQTNDYTIDETSEKMMFTLVNQERARVGLKPLKQDILIRNVARVHSIDMARNGYFAHEDLTGDTPDERLNDADVRFAQSAENIAIAPTVELAHIGLMNSPSHRENILSPDFKKIGIGIIDLGIYGKMVTQNFTN